MKGIAIFINHLFVFGKLLFIGVFRISFPFTPCFRLRSADIIGYIFAIKKRLINIKSAKSTITI